MRRLLLTLTVTLAIALTGATAFAQDTTIDPQITTQVKDLLGGIEHVPTASEWKALGPQAATVLRQIAADPKALPTRRSRAISALASFNDAESFNTLSSLLNDTKAPEIVKRKVLVALAKGYGDKAVDLVKPFMAHESRDVRESAIRAMGSVNTSAARTLLEQRLKAEPKEDLRKAIQTRLKASN